MEFRGTALLITLEPHRLMAWSCYQDPDQSEELRRVCSLETPDDAIPEATPAQRQIRELLHWVSLITGDFLRSVRSIFRAMAERICCSSESAAHPAVADRFGVGPRRLS